MKLLPAKAEGVNLRDIAIGELEEDGSLIALVADCAFSSWHVWNNEDKKSNHELSVWFAWTMRHVKTAAGGFSRVKITEYH